MKNDKLIGKYITINKQDGSMYSGIVTNIEFAQNSNAVLVTLDNEVDIQHVISIGYYARLKEDV